MTARLLGLDELDVAVAWIARGEVLGIPTDTVYGLAIRPDSDDALASLYALKHRPAGVPVGVLCADAADAERLAAPWPVPAARLAARWWPGPLTMVVPSRTVLAERLGSAVGIGVRVPDDDACRALLSKTGPLVVTSANLHGLPPQTTALGVASAFVDLAAVLDAGPRDGVVSTVLDLTSSTPAIVREGAIAPADLLRWLSEV